MKLQEHRWPHYVKTFIWVKSGARYSISMMMMTLFLSLKPFTAEKRTCNQVAQQFLARKVKPHHYHPNLECTVELREHNFTDHIYRSVLYISMHFTEKLEHKMLGF